MESAGGREEGSEYAEPVGMLDIEEVDGLKSWLAICVRNAPGNRPHVVATRQEIGARAEDLVVRTNEESLKALRYHIGKIKILTVTIMARSEGGAAVNKFLKAIALSLGSFGAQVFLIRSFMQAYMANHDCGWGYSAAHLKSPQKS